MIPDFIAALAYEKVNRLFAKEVAPHVRDDDLVWVHDYHLMLLPQFLREELGDTRKDVKIGFSFNTMSGQRHMVRAAIEGPTPARRIGIEPDRTSHAGVH